MNQFAILRCPLEFAFQRSLVSWSGPRACVPGGAAGVHDYWVRAGAAELLPPASGSRPARSAFIPVGENSPPRGGRIVDAVAEHADDLAALLLGAHRGQFVGRRQGAGGHRAVAGQAEQRRHVLRLRRRVARQQAHPHAIGLQGPHRRDGIVAQALVEHEAQQRLAIAAEAGLCAGAGLNLDAGRGVR